ncbi:MAG: ABC transporter ATP-binding protein [Planctomycetota bacterium]
MTEQAQHGGLTASGLHKRFGTGRASVAAVDGIDLTLAQGEFLAIVGASGSGKTTLLQLLAGLERPDQGRIRVAGQELTLASDRQWRRLRSSQLGVVFQAFNLLPTLSARDNVALPLLLAGVRRRRARDQAQRRLDQVGLSDRAHHRPGELSGGEQQRVALARAIVNDPRVVLADEPTGSLDRSSSGSVAGWLRDVVAADGRSVAMVTHDPFVAFRADRVVVIADGRIADQFDVSDVESAEALSTRTLHASEKKSGFRGAAKATEKSSGAKHFE